MSFYIGSVLLLKMRGYETRWVGSEKKWAKWWEVTIWNTAKLRKRKNEGEKCKSALSNLISRSFFFVRYWHVHGTIKTHKRIHIACFSCLQVHQAIYCMCLPWLWLFSMATTVFWPPQKTARERKTVITGTDRTHFYIQFFCLRNTLLPLSYVMYKVALMVIVREICESLY